MLGAIGTFGGTLDKGGTVKTNCPPKSKTKNPANKKRGEEKMGEIKEIVGWLLELFSKIEDEEIKQAIKDKVIELINNIGS